MKAKEARDKVKAIKDKEKILKVKTAYDEVLAQIKDAVNLGVSVVEVLLETSRVSQIAETLTADGYVCTSRAAQNTNLSYMRISWQDPNIIEETL